jgi:methylmalonyl-CoA/ethylmalonyl-CoA epimerase
MKLHHIGYAVIDLINSSKAFSGLGFTITNDIVIDNDRFVNILFLDDGINKIELVSPIAKGGSPVDGFLSKIGNGPYHLCFEVASLNDAIRDLKSKQYILIKSPAAAKAIENRGVAFLYNKYIGIIELVEKKEE